MPTTFHMLTPDDESLLGRVAPGVFDYPIDPDLAREFLNDPRHHIAVARDNDLDGGTVVAFASAIHYINPDKRPHFWINELGTAPTHRRQGLAARLLEMMEAHARSIGCTVLWVDTGSDNPAALACYRKMGWSETPGSVLFETRL